MTGDSRKYLIIGTGALGGFYGAKLAKSGLDVHFLVHSDSEYQFIKTHGLRVISRSGDIYPDAINCYNSPDNMPKGDVILVAIKAFSNNELKNILHPVLKQSSIVVLLQNGIGGEEYLAGFIDSKRIFGGLSILAVSKDSPGLINHHDFGSIKVGQYNPDGNPRKISSQLEEIVADFEKSGITAAAVPDLMQARWEKLVWNIPFSGLSVLLDADTKQIISNQSSLELSGEIIKDVASAAEVCGKTISLDFQQKMIDITVTMTPYFPSMKLDYDSGKPMEVEAIFGNPLRLARKAGYNAPYISMLYHLLKAFHKK
jgi:2-dehydropantoate 2-reductase